MSCLEETDYIPAPDDQVSGSVNDPVDKLNFDQIIEEIRKPFYWFYNYHVIQFIDKEFIHYQPL